MSENEAKHVGISREFWLDDTKQRLDNGKVIIFEAHRAPATGSIHVIDIRAYKTAIRALKKIHKDFGTDYADGNTMIAHDALEELGEL